MIISKRFILALLMIFLELNLKFIHGNKKNLKKINKKNQKRFNTKPQYYNIILNPLAIENNTIKKNVLIEKKNDIVEENIAIDGLFDIDEALISKGSDFLFALKEDNEIFNNSEPITNETISIGDLSIPYTYNNKNKEAISLQNFIEQHAADLLILFVIKSFLIKENFDIVINNNIKITQAEIKFKRKYYKSAGYKNIKLLEENVILYKKILLMLILNILNDNNDIKTSLIDKFIEILYPKNLFYNNELLKRQFISRLTKIETINKKFNINDYESILYFLAYYIKEQPEEFFRFILDKDFLRFILSNVDVKEKNENKDMLNKKKFKELDKDLINKENELTKELKIKEYSDIMKYAFSILQDLLK